MAEPCNSKTSNEYLEDLKNIVDRLKNKDDPQIQKLTRLIKSEKIALGMIERYLCFHDGTTGILRISVKEHDRFVANVIKRLLLGGEKMVLEYIYS